MTDTYDAATGSLATTSATYSDGATRTIGRVYDSIGRLTSYTDADGNTSTTTYDLLDRPVTTNDGKGTQTWGYDATSGLPTQMVDSAAGTFTAAYDGDGQMLTETLPNGLQQQNSYDQTGQLVHRSYVKVTNCSSNCTWLDFGGYRSIHDQWLSLTGTLGSQDYIYDGAGRLTRASDTPAGQGCTVRDYVYDADSNRTSQATHAPGTGGACDPSSAGTIKTHQYDGGDRLLDTSTTYDSFGSTTTLSASNSGGGSLANTYYADNLTRSASQDGVTNTYFRDPTGRLRSVQTIGGSGQTTTLHYADEGDGVAWQTESTDGSHWTRNIGGIGGDVAAIQDSNTGTTLQLENLHGDIAATASVDPNGGGQTNSQGSDEFGVPHGSGASRYSWLGGAARQTVLTSGVIEMGARQYVPALGRFSQMDPMIGGSANNYDYANQDPVNSFDLNGKCGVCELLFPHDLQDLTGRTVNPCAAVPNCASGSGHTYHRTWLVTLVLKLLGHSYAWLNTHRILIGIHPPTSHWFPNHTKWPDVKPPHGHGYYYHLDIKVRGPGDRRYTAVLRIPFGSRYLKPHGGYFVNCGIGGRPGNWRGRCVDGWANPS